MVNSSTFADKFPPLVQSALFDFACTLALEKLDVDIDVAPAPHRPRSLPVGKMAVYCFFFRGRALKIGIAGPNSGARYLSQHYHPRSAGSTLAG